MNNHYRIVCIVFVAIGFLMLGYCDSNNTDHERWVRVLGAVFTVLSSGGLIIVNVLRPGRHKQELL